MGYTNAEARKELLDSLALATNELGEALAALGEVYELLEEHTAEQMEERLFRPVQGAYGRARRAHADFAGRYGLPKRTFHSQGSHVRPNDARGGIDHAVEMVETAELELSTLQDSMLPVEVGDPEIRAGLAEVRMMIGDVPHQARELMRIFGR